MMKNFINTIVVVFFVSLCCCSALAQVNLPKVNIAGQTFYVYESKKGDSMYGVANRFGWNIDKLSELNPTLVKKLSKGSKVYYPADADGSLAKSEPVVFSAESYPVIQHIVKKGDSVYALSKMYGVPVDLIYRYNPDSKYGLKRGSVITIPQEPDAINDGSKFLFYAIKSGDTLNSIADTYNSSVEQILRDNKGISETNFEAGDILRVSVNSRKQQFITEIVDETKMTRVDSYVADKGDTWESVARKTGTDVDDLKEFNAGTDMKKNAHIDVPVLVTSQVETTVEAHDDREDSPEGMRDIYNDVHRIALPDSIGGKSVSIAFIIENPKSKRDNEFVRGALMAIDEKKLSPFKIKFKLLLDNHTASDSLKIVGTLVDSLDIFRPDVVISTYEKNFPVWLAQYGEENGVEIVNSFDVKNEFYIENPSMIQLLSPSAYFSEAVAEWENSAFSDFKVVFAGKKDDDDAFADAIRSKLDYAPEKLEVEALAEWKLDDWGHYLIYGYPTSKNDVVELISAVATLKENNPLASVKVLGRPNWITFADNMKEQFAKADVYFPSRFFFDHTGEEGKKFIADYSDVFGHGPIRSYPTYAVAGYDIMNYFIDNLAYNDGDFNKNSSLTKELQTPINLQRVGNWGGFFNPSAYVIRYNPFGEIEKILVKK